MAASTSAALGSGGAAAAADAAGDAASPVSAPAAGAAAEGSMASPASDAAASSRLLSVALSLGWLMSEVSKVDQPRCRGMGMAPVAVEFRMQLLPALRGGALPAVSLSSTAGSICAALTFVLAAVPTDTRVDLAAEGAGSWRALCRNRHASLPCSVLDALRLPAPPPSSEAGCSSRWRLPPAPHRELRATACQRRPGCKCGGPALLPCPKHVGPLCGERCLARAAALTAAATPSM